MLDSYIRWVFKHRWLVMLVTVAMCLLLGAGMSRLHFSTDYKYFFRKDNPKLQAFEAMQEQYSINNNVFIAVVPERGTVFEKDTLQAIHDLTQNAWKLPHVQRVDSLTNFQYVRGVGDEIQVRDLVDDPGSLDAADMAELRTIAANEPDLVGVMLNPDQTITGINLSVTDEGVSDEGNPALVHGLLDLIDDVKSKHPQLEFRVTGSAMIDYAYDTESDADVRRLFPVMMLIMVVLTWLIMRSLSAMIGTMICNTLAAIAALGVAGWMDITLTVVSIMAPTIILTLSLAHCMHVVSASREAMLKHGTGPEESLRLSLRENFVPMFLTTINTIIGFFAINIGDVPPLEDLGVIVTVGITVVYLLSLSFLVAYLSVFPLREPASEKNNERYARIALFTGRHYKAAIAIWTVITILSVAALQLNTINDQFVEYLSKDVPVRQDSEYISQNLTGIHQMHFSLDTASGDGIFDPEYMKELDAFAVWLRQQPGVRHVTSMSDVLKRLNKEMHGSDQNAYVLPDSRDQIAQYLLIYEMSLPYGLDVTDRIEMTRSATRVTATIDNLSSADILALDTSAQEWLETHSEMGMHTYGVGPVMMFADIGKRNAISMLKGTALGMVLIILTMVPAMRSFKLGVLCLIPNLLPPLIAFGIWGLIDGDVGLAVSVVVVMTFGIIVDNTVHMLSRYELARREGMGPAEAAADSLGRVGSAVVGTSVVLTVGFLVLAFSSFRLNSSMGILTAIVIVAALVAQFLLFPALLAAFDRGRSSRRKAVISEPVRVSTQSA